MEYNISALMQFAYCVFVVCSVALGTFIGAFIFFCLFGYFCMSLKPTQDNAIIKRNWINLWRGRAK